MSFGALLAGLESYRYLFLILGAPVFGPPVSLAAGIFIRLGSLDLLLTIACLMIIELAGDIVWYSLGFHFGHRFVGFFGAYVGITENHIAKVTALYHRYHDRIILISKLTAGFGIAPTVLFVAGLSRVPFFRYMLINALGQVVWTSTMLSIGYFFGMYVEAVSNDLTRYSVIGGIILFVAIVVGLANHFIQKSVGGNL